MSEDQDHVASEAELFGGQARSRRHDEVRLPIAGKLVRIQSLSELEYERYQAVLLNQQGAGRVARLVDAGRRLIVLCIVDQAGNRILNESHVAKFSDWDSADVQYLVARCQRHCGLDPEEIEALAKNSEAIRADA